MPNYRITAPDGRTFDVTAPDGTSPDEVMRRVQEHAGQATVSAPKREEPFGPRPGGLTASAVPFGLSDEVAGLAGSLVGGVSNMIRGEAPSWGAEFDRARQADIARKTQAMDGHPVLSTMASIAGSGAVAPGAGFAMASTAPTLGGRMVQAGKIGAAYGAAEGAGNADGDLGDAALGAVGGAALGGATGALAAPAIEGIARGGRAAYNAVADRMPFNQATAAQRQVAEKLVADHGDMARAIAKLDELNAATGGQAALLDIGPATMGKARGAYAMGGEGKKAIGDFLTGRQEGAVDSATGVRSGGQYGRLMGALDEQSAIEFGMAKKAIEADRKAFGADYEAARNSGAVVDIDPLIKELDAKLTPAKGGIKSALERARSYLVDADGKAETGIDALHNAKMAIDDLISNASDSSIGNVARGQLKTVQKKLVEAIEKAAPDYRTGREGTAAQWALDEALESGRLLMSKGKFPAPDAVAAMSPEEKHALRIGAVQALRDRLGSKVVRADATKALWGIPELERRLAAVFDDPGTFAQYAQRMQGEGELFQAYGKILGGSRTAEVEAEKAGLGVDPGRLLAGARDMATGTPGGLVRGGVNMAMGAKDWLSGQLGGRGVGRELAKLLTQQGPAASATLRDLENQAVLSSLSDRRRQSLARLLAAGGSVGVAQ